MEVVGGALTSLIKNLIPDGNQHYPITHWVEEELQPLLSALNHKTTETQDDLEANFAIDSVTQVILGAVVLILAITGIVTFYCIRHNQRVISRLSDGELATFDQVGQSVPNKVPNFRL